MQYEKQAGKRNSELARTADCASPQQRSDTVERYRVLSNNANFTPPTLASLQYFTLQSRRVAVAYVTKSTENWSK